MRISRFFILALGCGVLAAAFLLDGPDDSVADRSNPFAITARPEATSEGYTTTWVCPVLVSEDLGVDAHAEIVLVNPLDVTVDARITFEGRSTPSETVILELGPLSRTIVDDLDLPPESERAALVEVGHRAVVVARTFTSDQGEDSAPCGNQVSDNLTIASGSTRVDGAEVLVLYNPYSDDAVVDVVAASDAEFGFFEAGELEGIVIPAGSIHSVSIDSAVRRRDVVSLYVSLRKGRVVADRLMRFDGTDERRGFSADLASSAGSVIWYLPVGPRTEVEQLVLFNPGETPAEVDVEFQVGVDFVPPIQRTVPPNDFVIVDIEIDAPTLERDVMHGIVVRSQNAVEIAVDLVAGEDLTEAQAFDRLASFDMSATADRATTTWVVPTLRSDETTAGVLLVQNPTDGDVGVVIDAVASGSARTLQTLSIPARSVQLVTVNTESDMALLVRGDAEIVVASALSEERPAAEGWMVAVPLDLARG